MKWVVEKVAGKSVEEMKMTMDIELNWLSSDEYIEQVGVPAKRSGGFFLANDWSGGQGSIKKKKNTLSDMIKSVMKIGRSF